MLGTKIRSWMEAHIVRPRKKHHRSNKEGTIKKRFENGNAEVCKDEIKEAKSSEPPCLPVTVTNTQVESQNQTDSTSLNDSKQVVMMRGQDRGRLNHNNNLSSPESAYSTGYSTDGTSPGASCPTTTAPPEYYINIRTGIRYFHSSTKEAPSKIVVPEVRRPWEQTPETVSMISSKITSPALNSPRQRNRIRTNPWVPETTKNSCKCSPLHSRLTPGYISNNVRSFRNGSMGHVINTSSPVRKKWIYNEKKQHCSRFSSSSSSSTSSVSSVHEARVQHKASSEDDDDRTLNEMMGKYDESYVYEKETDILSDSDPTDCDEDYNDSDAEDGREGGDERDLLDDDEDFDFIDNGSLELNFLEDGTYINKGHCTYHMFQGDYSGTHRESGRTSRINTGTPTNLRNRRSSERRVRRASSKKKIDRNTNLDIQFAELNKFHLKSRLPGYLDGSRSAGNTPVCIRRRRALNEYHESRYEKRCNSVSSNGPIIRKSVYPRAIDCVTAFNEKDKEADKKYKELIIEAEHILMSMKTFRPPVGSPKRIALGPANKRVELLRNGECGTEIKPPINNDLNGVLKEKFSPKRNHITNFINHNSPIISRRELDKDKKDASPLSVRKEKPQETPIVTFKPVDVVRTKQNGSCPQSEPVKRKVYTCSGPLTFEAMHILNVESGRTENAGNKDVRIVSGVKYEEGEDGVEFQQHKLFQTLTSLKRNLESQSEALRQSCYGSSQRLSHGGHR